MNFCITMEQDCVSQETIPCSRINIFKLDWNLQLSMLSSEEKFYGQTRKNLSSLATMTRGMFSGVKVRLLNLQSLYQLSSIVVVACCLQLFCYQGYWYITENGQNNKGELPLNSSSLPQINSLIVETWTKLGVSNGQWSQRHIKTGFGVENAGKH